VLDVFDHRQALGDADDAGVTEEETGFLEALEIDGELAMWLIGTMPPSGPPIWMALIFVLKPPARSMTVCSGVPMATS
jgi:hypothetical protein